VTVNQSKLLPPKLVLSHSMSPSSQEEKDLMSEAYLTAVGSLQYLAIITRPDVIKGTRCDAKEKSLGFEPRSFPIVRIRTGLLGADRAAGH